MKIRRVPTALLMAVSLMWVFAAQAGTTPFKGVSVDYGNASTNWVNGDLVLAYTSAESDTLSLGGCVQARILLVGGGGSGSSGGGSKQTTGYAGAGGTVVEKSYVLLAGECTINVGAGGASVKGGSSSRTSGKAGGKTTFSVVASEDVNLEAGGGAGGGSSDPSSTAVKSDITGTSTAYGQNGGKGADSKASSGAGGAGTVIVRLTGLVPLITGKIRVGAYEVDVKNASRTNWVDGELVVTYLNTDAIVGKSFTLPQPTTGRLLAVGGGGAGGQDQKQDYSANYGLPGGGGAGGLVIRDAQAFEAKTYEVSVGAGGAAVARTLTTIDKTTTWIPASYGAGANGGDSTVKQGTTAIVTAKGGGGGGRRSAGNAGGSGGGGSANYSSKTVQPMDGGSGTSGQGNSGGQGGHAKFGAGGGGAGGQGGPTTKAETSEDPTTKNVDGSGAGGPGKLSDITGESLEYARGGAGGVPRVYLYYYYKGGVVYYTKNQPTDKQKKDFDNGKFFWVEASDGKPGRDGFGDGGGGSGHYNTNPTFAGRGGNGAVIVRIPPYETTVEDALKAAFAGRTVTVSGSSVTLTDDVTGPVEIPDNLGVVTVNLNGHAIAGADGAAGDDIAPGGNGESALKIVKPTLQCSAGATQVRLTGSGTVKGGDGGDGHPQGVGAAALSGNAEFYDRGDSVTRTDGADGKFIDQHPHAWEYECFDNKIYAYCVADDEETCSYKKPERRPVLVFEAADVDFTGEPYAGLTLVNTITEATGLPVPPPVYEGVEGTDYPESRTAPVEQGRYRVSLAFRNLTISDTFTIVEAKQEQDSVYKSWKTAVRNGDEVKIMLSATFSGNRAINDGNVLFLGSRCSAHSMASDTIALAINAMAKYADVRWYAYGSSDSDKNNLNMLTKKGSTVKDDTVTLRGANHFVHKEMMDDLYAELIDKKNLKGDYDLIILEFDGDLLCREGFSPYQLHYKLPDGWDETKAAQLRAVMEKYYQAGRVVWIVPDVNEDKEDAGYTGAYPWSSNPEFIWQRAFLRATETEGYKNPLQKNYENGDELVDYIEKVLIGAFFQETTITDTVKKGLDIVRVVPQVRDNSGFWVDMMSDDGKNFSVIESHYGVEITAQVTVTGQKVVTVFDTHNVQVEAIKRGELWGNDLKVSIETKMTGDFFKGVGSGEWKDTNEGDAIFVFRGSESGEEFEITSSNAPPKLQNVLYEPSYRAEDWVSIYDGEGHTITVTVTSPDPTTHPFDIKYSLTEDGTYAKDLLVTNRSDKVPVWFEISDPAGQYLTVTNKAYVTILPRVVVEQAEDGAWGYDSEAHRQPAHSNVLSRAVEEAEKLYSGQGAEAAGFVKDEGFDKVPMTGDSAITDPGTKPNVIDKGKVTFKDNTDPNNYIFIYLPGTLTVTKPLPIGILAFDAEKFYDAEPTNITYVVTNAQGVAITPDRVYLRERDGEWVEAKDFVPYVDTTNVTVEVKAEKSGFDPVTAEATVLVKPRPVTLVAASDSKTYDGLPLTNWTFTVKEDATTPGYGFVKEEGVSKVTMTPESTVTDPGSQPNVIATETAKEGTKLDRNYEVTTEPGTLTVTAASMGIAAFDAEKFYDAEPTNVTWVVTNAQGVAITDAVISLREQGTDEWIPVADFVPYVDTTNVTVEVRAEKAGFDPVTAEATVLVKPRPVTLVAASDSKTYDGLPLTNWTFTVKTDTETPGYGFVKEEGVSKVTMTDDSTITDPGSQPNVIASETAKEGTKLGRANNVTEWTELDTVIGKVGGKVLFTMFLPGNM